MLALCSKTRSKFKIYCEMDGLQVELRRGSCEIVQLLQLDSSVLGLPEPLLPVGLSGLRCPDVDLRVNVLVVEQLDDQQLLGQGEPTLKKNSCLAI